MTPAVNMGCRLITEPRSPSAKAAKKGMSRKGAEERKLMPLLYVHCCDTRMELAAIKADSDTPKTKEAAATATLASHGIAGVTGCESERSPSASAKRGTFIPDADTRKE